MPDAFCLCACLYIYKKITLQTSDLFDRYHHKGGAEAIPLDDVVDWLITEGHYELPANYLKTKCRSELQQTLRGKQHNGRSGHRYRKYFSMEIEKTGKDGKPEQLMLWQNVNDASRPELIKGFDVDRRHQVDEFAIAFDRDITGVNANNMTPGKPLIQLYFYDGESNAGEAGATA